MRLRQRGLLGGLLTAALLTLAACTSGGNDAGPDTAAAPTTAQASSTTSANATTSTSAAAPSTVEPSTVELDAEIRPGVEQLAVLDASPGLELELNKSAAGAADDTIATGTIDEFGSLLFRELDAADTYYVLSDDGVSGPYEVFDRANHPSQELYSDQLLPTPGFGYIETRDGTTLSANVALPGPVEDGPYPTVVEYSGYQPSDPDQAGFSDIFNSLGYAYVGVNIRGTGCSGGSFRFFEYAQSLDGYDAIETIAAQPWVLNNRVGMVGVSYPGISQLFVAQTQPPSLAAITPLSVLDDSYNSTLYPGGLLNTGFAVDWTQDRVDQARPEGQGWETDRIADGDGECANNQRVRLQNPDLVEEILDNPFYDPLIGDVISPRLFVNQINVPTLIAGAWQDEQTGGRFPTMLDQFTGTDHLYASLVNGLHTESIGPGVFPRWIEFLDLYVAERTPTLGAARVVAPILAATLFGVDHIELPPDRFEGLTHAEALAIFEAEQPIQVLFEEGAADGQVPGSPVPRFVRSFDAWPIPELTPTRWYLGTDASLTPEPDADASTVEYLALPDGIPPTFYEGNPSDIWRTDVAWDWQEPAPGTAATFISDPLPETIVMAGSGSADLWINSNLGDTDLEVTISEVRPDGLESYVQSGWLRASHRALDESMSSDLRPVQTHSEDDAEPLPDGKSDNNLALARVEIFPFAHVFREGSQIRISIDSPGGNRATWVFETISNGERVQIGLGGEFASSVVLPVVPGIDVPAEYPECGALRGQPCRTAPE